MSKNYCLPFNPISAKSDKHQFSPNITNMQSIEKITRIDITHHQKGNALVFQILSSNSVRKCIEISWENLYVDTGA